MEKNEWKKGITEGLVRRGKASYAKTKGVGGVTEVWREMRQGLKQVQGDQL